LLNTDGHNTLLCWMRHADLLRQGFSFLMPGC
jgi:hypothetical protein